MSGVQRPLPKPLDDKRVKKAAKETKAKRDALVLFIKGAAHSDSNIKKLIEARDSVFLIDMEVMKNRQLPYYLIDITPSDRQRKILDALFMIPELVKKLIDQNIDKHPEVNEFLLTNKESFYSAIGSNNWEACVGFFRAFLEQYLNSDMVSLEIPVGDDCSISKDYRIFIGGLTLGLVNAANVRRVLMIQQWREYEGFRYLKNFSILKFNGSYFVKLKYQEDIFFLKKNKDMYKELVGTFEVLLDRKFSADLKESQRFRRAEISESPYAGSGGSVNHAHQRDPRKKW